MPGFHSAITQLINGDPVEQTTLNTPLQELQDNVLYLRDLLNASVAGPALFRREVTMAAGVQVGYAVYYDHTNSRYDNALADGTAKENVVGLCLSKQNDTLGDIVTLGYATLDITGAVGGSVVAGRYFLSTTTAGRLTATQPSPSVLVCLADGEGDVFVRPQKGPTVPTALTASGTTTNAAAAVFSATNVAGLFGAMSVKNTGSAGLTVSLSLTDLYGSTAPLTVNVAAGARWSIGLHEAPVAGATPPYSTAALTVASQVADTPTTYAARGSVVN